MRATPRQTRDPPAGGSRLRRLGGTPSLRKYSPLKTFYLRERGQRLSDWLCWVHAEKTEAPGGEGADARSPGSRRERAGIRGSRLRAVWWRNSCSGHTWEARGAARGGGGGLGPKIAVRRLVVHARGACRGPARTFPPCSFAGFLRSARGGPPSIPHAARGPRAGRPRCHPAARAVRSPGGNPSSATEVFCRWTA